MSVQLQWIRCSACSGIRVHDGWNTQISKNWAGRPLDSYETILKYIRTTTTSSGLRVRAHLIRRRYPKGVKITDERMQALSVTKDQTLPKWNYTIRPS